jgi:hypothetical protein
MMSITDSRYVPRLSRRSKPNNPAANFLMEFTSVTARDRASYAKNKSESIGSSGN